MKHVLLGSTGMKVSAVCMGTVGYGSKISEKDSFAAFDRFVEMDGNFLDTARVYADWIPTAERQASEKVIGRWIKARHYQDRVFVATKGGHYPLGTNEPPTLSEAELCMQADESRENLCLDIIPLYYLHRDDPSLPVAQIMDAVFVLQDKGIIRHAACSNWTAPRIREAQAYAQQCGRAGFAVVSNQWSLARTVPGCGDPTLVRMDDALMQFHTETQLPLLPFTSMGQGYLSKLSSGAAINPALTAQYGVTENEGIARRAAEVAQQRGMTVAQVCQCFFYAQPFQVIPLIAFSTNTQMDEAVAATDMQLTADEVNYICHG